MSALEVVPISRLQAVLTGFAMADLIKKLQAVILINNRRETLTVDLPIWQIGILENACLKRVIQTTQSTYNIGEVMERAEDGILHVTVGPQTASVYIAAKNVEEN